MRAEVELRAAGPDETELWHTGWVQRIEDWYGRFHALRMADRRLTDWSAASGRVYTLTVADTPVGTMAVAERAGAVVIHDIWVEPAHRGTGVGVAARTGAERLATGQGAGVAAMVATDDPAAQALFAGYPLRAQRMVKRLDPARTALDGPGWRARPMTADEYGPWRAEEELGYAGDIAGSGSATPEEAAESARTQFAELMPAGLDSPGYTWWVLEADGVPVGTIWLIHQWAPGLSFVYSVAVWPAYRGQGHGRTTMLAGEAVSLAAGDQALGLNVFGQNTVAIGLYRGLGYAVVEQSRSVGPVAAS
jgi:ribosomal protein S18 acetylase RimI-like enzyme